MSRKVVRMTLDHLAELEAPCRTCVFWELDPVSRARVDDPADEKEAWVSTVLREWGSCGRVALQDDRPVGYVLYAPPAFFRGAGAFPTAPVSADAVLLSAAYVDPSARGGGFGRMLVQGMARDLIERGGIHAVEAFGDTRGPGLAGGGRCVTPTCAARSRGATRSRPRWNACSAPYDPPRSRARTTRGRPAPGNDQAEMNSSSSLSSAALGRAPTIVFTTSPPE
jgi:GNAT superfamily N-acetyltransferase